MSNVDRHRISILNGRRQFGSFAFVPPQYDGAGDVDGGIRSRDNAHEEHEREIIDDRATIEIQRSGGKQSGAGGDNGATESLVQRGIHHISKRAARAEA